MGGEEDLDLGTHGVMRSPGSRHGSGWESAGGHRPLKLGSRVMWSEAEGPLEASSSWTVWFRVAGIGEEEQKHSVPFHFCVH